VSVTETMPESRENVVITYDIGLWASYAIAMLVWAAKEQITRIYIVARMWRLYKKGIKLTTGFIGSHTVTHNYSAYTL
jgi:hypothetical protein